MKITWEESDIVPGRLLINNMGELFILTLIEVGVIDNTEPKFTTLRLRDGKLGTMFSIGTFIKILNESNMRPIESKILISQYVDTIDIEKKG